MKALILLLVFISASFAESFILYTEQMESRGKIYWVITACKDGYRYTIIKDEPLEYMSITQDFETRYGKLVPVPCQSDFKSPEQLAK